VNSSSRRLGQRSAIAPPQGASSGIGRKLSAIASPKAVADPSVRITSTSQSVAVRDTHRPVLDTSIPEKNSR